MSDNKEKITETIGIISAIVGIVKLIIGLFEKKEKGDCCSHKKGQ